VRHGPGATTRPGCGAPLGPGEAKVTGVTVAAWIAIGVFVLGLILLVLLALSVRRRLRPLKVAAAALQAKAVEAQDLQERLDELQPRLEEMAMRMERIQTKTPAR